MHRKNGVKSYSVFNFLKKNSKIHYFCGLKVKK
jgi:hypothetical protein